MDTEYRQFGSSDSSIVLDREHRVPVPKGLKNVVAYLLYGVLLLLLLVLLMVTGIKFSQLNKEITDVKHHLEKISKAGVSSPHSAPAVQDVPLDGIVAVRGSCREGWSSFKTSCYLLSTSAVTWRQAEEQCKTQRGHLLVPNTVEELDYISRIVEIKYDYWIGLVEREEDHWTWVDGTDFSTTHTFWDEGQPDDWDLRENGEDCGQLHSSRIRKRKLWNDADCGLKYRFICESRA